MRDAANPEALFWKYAGRSLLPLPATVAEWFPVDSDDLGFDLPVRVRDPFRMLVDLIDRSDDVRRLLSLADELGPGGRQVLCNRLKGGPAFGAVSSKIQPVRVAEESGQ